MINDVFEDAKNYMMNMAKTKRDSAILFRTINSTDAQNRADACVKQADNYQIAADSIALRQKEQEPCEACKTGVVTIRVPEFNAVAAENQWMNRKGFTLTLRDGFCPTCGKPLKGGE